MKNMNLQTMSVQEVCEVLGISVSTLRRRVNAGELKPVEKSPGQKRAYRLNFLRTDIEELLKRSRQEQFGSGSKV